MIVGLIRCRNCGESVSHDIRFDEDGVPYFVCSNCGKSRVDYDWFKYVDQAEALEIIEHRGRRGLFVQKDGARFVGIDNRDGDAWTEDFPTLSGCLMWLLDDEKEEGDSPEQIPQYETGGGPAEDVELRQYRCLRCGHIWYEDCDAPDYPDYCPGCGNDLCRGGAQE